MQIPQRELLIHRKIEELKNSSEILQPHWMQSTKSNQKNQTSNLGIITHANNVCARASVNCFSSLRYACVESFFPWK